MIKPLLSIQNLQAGFIQDGKEIAAVNGLHLDMHRGETLAIVGESGCGKSLTALSVMGLHGSRANMPGTFVRGDIWFDNKGERPINLAGLTAREYDELRGNCLSMIFQEPMTALNPLLTAGEQVAEMLVKHKRWKRSEAWTQAQKLLEQVGIPEAASRMKSYPFQLSGGQKQRVMIAMAMSCNPALLIADEPTTALDVTIQAQILYLLKRIKQSQGTSILFITHNLGIVAQFADRVAVMYRGMIVESGSTRQLLGSPAHPYTQLLLRSLPRRGQRAILGDRLEGIQGTVPSPSVSIPGCPFHPRCPYAQPQCMVELPAERSLGSGHMVRCMMKEGVVTHESVK